MLSRERDMTRSENLHQSLGMFNLFTVSSFGGNVFYKRKKIGIIYS